MNNEPVGFGIVFVDDVFAGFHTQEMAALGAFIARALIRDDDACTAVNANGNRGGPKIRFTDLGQGRAGCVEMFDSLERLKDIWLGTGMEVGVFPYSWVGTQKAAKVLAGDPHLRRAVLLLCLGRDADHFGLPQGLIRMLVSRGIEAYALYYGPEDLNDPETLARYRKYGVSPLPPDFTPGYPQKLTKPRHDLERLTEESGGKFYPVTRTSAPGEAIELVSNLRRGCVLTYSPKEDLPAATYRKIDVEVAQKGWKVRHRPGYYPNQVPAPSGKPSK